jgi:hypothetical protein
MVKKHRIYQYIIGGYLLLSSFLCIAFLVTDTGSKPSETIAAAVFLPLSLIFSWNFLFPVFMHKLVYTREGIEYITTFSRKFFTWNEFSEYEFVQGVLHAYFNLDTLTPARKWKEFLFGDPNDIPLSHFIEGCNDRRTWRSDLVLCTIASIIREREEIARAVEEQEEAARAAEEQMDWESMESED